MTRVPVVPAVLQRRANDEFRAPPLRPTELVAARGAARSVAAASDRLRMPAGEYADSRLGLAAGLLAVNDVSGADYFAVPATATLDPAAADEAFGGDQLVIDVQTHYIADRAGAESSRELIRAMYPVFGPDWWDGLAAVHALDLVEYLRCVFLESDTAVAVLTSGPGLTDERMLFNDEMAGTRLLLDRLGADGRLLNHAVVHPNVDGEVAAMAETFERFGPAGWKVYTLGAAATGAAPPIGGWFLDDDVGVGFLESVRASGARLVCAHKGISGLVPAGSPRDIGPAAAMFPDIDFVVYHSGFEPATDADVREGPYTEQEAALGVNRLVRSLAEHGIAPGSNVYAELGTTWFCLIKRPEEAAHVLGKLLLAVGTDNVLWGTDAIWYGPTQAAVDAFRAFQIPAAMQDEFGYPALTPEVKAKILGLNAAAVYGIDPATARSRMGSDNIAWAQAAIAEYRSSGTPRA